MIQEATALGNWWLAASSWQCTCSCILSLTKSFLAKHQTIHVTQSPYSPDLALYGGSLWRLVELCEYPKCLFDGDWGVIVLRTVFLVSCIFFNQCLCFSYYMDGYIVDRPHTSFHKAWQPFQKWSCPVAPLKLQIISSLTGKQKYMPMQLLSSSLS